MNTKHQITSTLTGKFSDIVDFLTAPNADEADQLARRAVGIIATTDRPQTGEEVDTDPFVANMLASAALVSISENIKQYPFVSNSADFDQAAMLCPGGLDVIDTARELIERAEALIGLKPQPEPVAGFFGVAEVPPALAAFIDEAICRTFEETGLLPSAVILIIDDAIDPTVAELAETDAAAGEPVATGAAS